MNSLDTMSPDGDRRFTWAVWAVLAVASAVCVVTVLTGAAPGIGPQKHPAEYLLVSNIAVFLLISVVPALRLLGLVRMPWWFNFLLVFDVYLYVVSLTCGFYLEPSMPWWGYFGHIVSSLTVGGICFLALCLVQGHSKGKVDLGGAVGVLAILFMTTVSFGAVWEVLEGYLDIGLGRDYMSYGVLDSMQDLQADAIGAVLIVVVAALILRTRTLEDVASTTKLGRLHRVKRVP